MPLYEYLCGDCGGKSTFLTRSMNSSLEPSCQACGSGRMQRAVSSFAIGKTVRQVHDGTGPVPEDPGMDFYRDPRNIGRNVEERFQQWGMELPEQAREAIDAAREGAPPAGLDW
ncbi:MAG: zinc ribbon domain-containing protein [Chloroflexi bacterium]|nr:zinc ribbon domain-containing protein [Chloroflexota bacterium]